VLLFACGMGVVAVDTAAGTGKRCIGSFERIYRSLPVVPAQRDRLRVAAVVREAEENRLIGKWAVSSILMMMTVRANKYAESVMLRRRIDHLWETGTFTRESETLLRTLDEPNALAAATASFWKAINDKDGTAAAAVVADWPNLHWCASREGASTLHWAASSGFAGAVAALIGAGAAVGARSKDGTTPLDWAARGGHASTETTLLCECADSDRSGVLPSALKEAADRGHPYGNRCAIKPRYRGFPTGEQGSGRVLVGSLGPDSARWLLGCLNEF